MALLQFVKGYTRTVDKAAQQHFKRDRGRLRVQSQKVKGKDLWTGRKS